MACDKAQEWIHLHMDRSLDGSNEALLMAHLEVCDVCSKDYEILMSIHQVLQSTDEVDLPSDFHESLMKKIEKRPKRRQNILFIKQLNVAAVIVFVLVFSLIGINNLNQNKSMDGDEAAQEMLSMSAVSEESSEIEIAMDATEFEDASLSRASNENERSQKATSESLLQEVDPYGNNLLGLRYDQGWMIVMVGVFVILGILIVYIKLKF